MEAVSTYGSSTGRPSTCSTASAISTVCPPSATTRLICSASLIGLGNVTMSPTCRWPCGARWSTITMSPVHTVGAMLPEETRPGSHTVSRPATTPANRIAATATGRQRTLRPTPGSGDGGEAGEVLRPGGAALRDTPDGLEHEVGVG